MNRTKTTRILPGAWRAFFMLALAALFVACGGKQEGDAAAAQADTTAVDSVAPAFEVDLTISAGMRALLDEANRTFTWQDEPIHPFGLRDLLETSPDAFPGPVALDVAGINGGRRYAGPWSVEADGAVRAAYPQPESGFEDDSVNTGYFTYRRIGILPNGWHVLRTGDNGGGEAVFETLLLVRFWVDREYGDPPRERLIMERRGVIALGDRYDGRITLRGDSLTLTADIASGYRTEDKTYGFDNAEGSGD